MFLFVNEKFEKQQFFDTRGQGEGRQPGWHHPG